MRSDAVTELEKKTFPIQTAEGTTKFVTNRREREREKEMNLKGKYYI